MDINKWIAICNIVIVFIATALNSGFAYYVFIYQKKKDKILNKKEEEEKLKAETIRKNQLHLEWLKELIVLPNINNTYSFFEEIERLLLNEDGLNEIELNDKVKQYVSVFRHTFPELLSYVNYSLYEKLKNHLDDMTDSITEKLLDAGEFEDSVTKNSYLEIISRGRNLFISEIYRYEG